ncbi:hypothetical protein BKA70DRAFT_1272694 [Coprinopsis sp. MPI-PUGE-AT-0042]|nr:hypothetical protein BKA70DRAFT_1272694 [Coprinopsis sp. MPI-PUGE-AT-0042]
MQRNDLKTQIRDAEALYSKATKAELARRYDQAYEHYVRAAELFLHLSRSSQEASEKDKAKWKTNGRTGVASALSPGPPSSGSASPNPPSNTLLTPVYINHFASHEQYYVLKKGSYVNGLVFPLWDESQGPDPCANLFTDPDGQPQLSPEQSSVSPVWKRPPHHSEPKTYDAAATPRILAQDVLQHIVTDCSVCASISVCLEHGMRFGSYLAESPMDHYIEGKDSDVIDIKFLLNGAWRRVLIDDRLPYHPQDGTLMCMSISSASKCPFAIWPSLMEKAYMKLMGGYDFPGSNSSIDLHAIAGWIPEHVEIRRSDFERERTWQRMFSGFTKGHCVVTLGTGVRPVSFDTRLKLLPSHSYAVTDVFESDEGRRLTVLDSWVHEDEDPVAARSRQCRLVNISYSNALNMFDGIYLSWTPSIWENHIQFHGMWKRRDPEDVTKQLFLTYTHKGSEHGTEAEAGQDLAASDGEEEIWVLLTRHLSDTHRTEDFVALRVQLEDDVKGAMTHGQQAFCVKETYTNSTHILSRTRLKPSEPSGILSILASYAGDASEVGFTLSVYSRRNVEIAWDEKVSSPTYVSKVEGSFTLRTAGGNHTNPSFMVNPQYRLVVHPPKNAARTPNASSGQMMFTLQSSKDMPVNAAIVRSKSEDKEHRVTELVERDIIATSGPYSYGHAKISSKIAPGEYVLVVSSFQPEATGSFNFKVESMHSPFELTSIPQEGAGMYAKTITGSWKDGNSGGGPTSPKFASNPKYEVEVAQNTQFKARLQLTRKSNSIPLNITIYPATNGSPTTESLTRSRHVATSGPYDDGLAGVATPIVTLTPGKYWAVPSTFRSGVQADFRLLLWYSSQGIKIKTLP